jgi:alpha-glucosidase
MRSFTLSVAAALLATLLAAVPASAARADSWEVRSPSEQVVAEVLRNAGDGTIRLEVRRAGARVTSSQLGLRTGDADLTRNLRLVEQSVRTVHEEYETAVGKRRQHDDTARELSLTFADARGRQLGVQVRAFDDGIGYRYTLPGSGDVQVLGEASSFDFPAATRMWAAEHRANYENLYDKLEVGDVEDVPYQFPALFRLPHGAWTLVSESDVDGRYAASHLRPAQRPGSFRVEFPQEQATARGVEAALPLATPWRLAIVGDLADIVESDLVTDLAADQRFPVPDWVRPGKVAWSWWSDGGSPRSFERQRDYVEHAAEEGWQYVLVDEGWDPAWVPELVEYARQRDVRVLLWSRWTDLDTESERDTLLPRWKSWGVAGLKIDFMDSDSQARMRWYDEILADTAEQHLAVNFHGSTIPHGLERTWPHLMTMEGVRGAEDYHFGYLTPQDNAILPFSRNVVGSMDYTPVTFSAERRETTAGHELALGVLYESGWQHPADSAETYDSRGVAEAVLRELPTAWDDTEFLSGRPGESAALARRHGQEWFVGAIRAGGPRDLRIPLDFLDRDRRYVAEIVHDSGPDELDVQHRTVRAGQTLSVPAERNGGAVVLLCPAEQGSCLDDDLLSRVSLDTEDAYLAPGSSHTVSLTVTSKGRSPLERVSAQLTAPQGWSVEQDAAALPATVAPGDEAMTSWRVEVPADAEPGSKQDLRATVTHGAAESAVERTAVRTVHIQSQPAPQNVAHLSDLTPLDSFNWVGPVETDSNNGGDQPGDGAPITLDGKVYAKGLGGHAHSEQVYYLGKGCERFRAVVGLDDAAGARGSVVFQVWGDEQLLYVSGLHTASTPPESVDVDVRDVESLRLVLADGGDFVPDDLGDWADARVHC